MLAKPQHERKHFFREIFTLDKWASMTAYGGADQRAPAGHESAKTPIGNESHNVELFIVSIALSS